MPCTIPWSLLLVMSLLPPHTYAQTTPAPPSMQRSTLPPGWQDEWTAATYPNPQIQPLDCRRGRQRSWVCDPNMVLSKGEADDVDNLLKSNHSETCYCESDVCASIDGYGGLQGSVAIIQKMYFRESHPSAETKLRAAEAFADDLRNEFWKFGLCEDDYVIFVSKEDRQVYTSCGGKAHMVLTDRCVSEVFDKVRPHLANGEFSSALKTMVEDYILVGQKKHACNSPKSAAHIIGGVFGGVIALIICCACCAYCQSRRDKKSSYSTETRSPIYKPAPTTEPPREECIQPPPREECIQPPPREIPEKETRNSPRGSHHGGSHDDVGRERDARGSKESVASKQSGGGGGGF